MKAATPPVEREGSVGMTARHEPRVVKPLTAAEASRRGRVISTRMPTLEALKRLTKAAKLDGITVHRFALNAILEAVDQRIAIATVQKEYAASHASNLSPEANVSVSGGRTC